MKTQIKTITPEWAAQVLDTRNPNNRKMSERFVERLVRDIKANGWILTHQGIAFDENGDLIDGQHRLEAIRRANKSVSMPVTTGLPASQRANGIMLKTFECIDSGRARGVGQMLSMNCWPNGNKMAAVVRSLANWVSNTSQWLALSTPQTEKILAKCGKHVDWSVRATHHGLVSIPAGARAALTLYHMMDEGEAEEFADKLTSLDSVKRTHPAFALATWIKNHPRVAIHDTLPKVSSSAIYHNHNGNEVDKIYANEQASEWILSANKQLADYIKSIITL